MIGSKFWPGPNLEDLLPIPKIGPGQNLLPTIKDADYADILFIGGDQKLMQWSVSQGKVTKDYGHTMAGKIYSMA